MKIILFKFYKSLKNLGFSKKVIYYYYRFTNKYLNKVVIDQNKDYKSIPIIIISFNQLYHLKKLIDFLKEKGYLNIVIVDNNSSYQPLLEYFDEIKDFVTIHRLKTNLGHKVFWEEKELFREYSKGYYVVTDPDIVPLSSCPDDFLLKFKQTLDNNRQLSKVGFSLKIDDIPDTNPNKSKVVDWEQRFWNKKNKQGDFKARIDTTFALYPPKNIWQFRQNFYHAIRMNLPYTARHGGWYIDPDNLTDEQAYFIKTANTSSSWNINEEGSFSNEVCY